MRQKNVFLSVMTLLCLFFVNDMMSQQDFVKDLNITPNEAKIQFEENPNMGYLLEIGGPSSYYWRKQLLNEKEINLKNLSATGKAMPDGSYTIQVTPIFLFTPEQRTKMREVSQSGDLEALAALKTEYGIPEDGSKFFNYNFHILKGEFAVPELKEVKSVTPTITTADKSEKHFGAYASLNQRLNYSQNFSGRAWDNSGFNMEDDQVILDDLIVEGSGCFGLDCSNGESFGFDTVRLKENNLRIRAVDTSNSASFPSNDWQITFNDSSNGGQNKFSIDDIDGGKTPFTIEAGAPSHSLYVDDGGRIGIGTSTPVVEIHNKDGDTPTLRLEQDGTSGFTPQTWDVAGNETNFFVRDATGGQDLPFRIFTDAGANVLNLKNGKVGIKNTNPSVGLYVNTTDALRLPLGTTAQRPGATEGMLRGNMDNNSLEYFDGSSWTEVTLGGSQLLQVSSTGGAGTGVKISSTSANQYSTVDFCTTGGQAGQILVSGPSFSNGFFSSNSAIFATYLANGNVELAAGGTNGMIRFATNGIATSNERMRINAGGNVGIGTTANTYLLQVGDNGDGSEARANAWNTFSDKNLKRDFQKIENALDKLSAINGYYYYWNKDKKDQTKQVGVIAQELEAVLPEIVSTDKEGVKSVDYSKISALLIEAVKEQKGIIAEQQSEITSLQTELAELKELKAQVAQLTEMVMKQSEASGSNEEEVGKE